MKLGDRRDGKKWGPGFWVWRCLSYLRAALVPQKGQKRRAVSLQDEGKPEVLSNTSLCVQS